MQDFASSFVGLAYCYVCNDTHRATRAWMEDSLRYVVCPKKLEMLNKKAKEGSKRKGSK